MQFNRALINILTSFDNSCGARENMLLMENWKGKAKRKGDFHMPKDLYTCRYLSKLIVHVIQVYNGAAFN